MLVLIIPFLRRRARDYPNYGASLRNCCPRLRHISHSNRTFLAKSRHSSGNLARDGAGKE